MTKSFDMNTIGLINTFEKKTHVNVQDCVFDEKNIYFLVEFGKAGMAIGKNGKNIKGMQRIFKKNVKVFEYSEKPKKIIKNMIPTCNSIEIEDGKATVKISPSDKGKIIGRMGSNIKKIRELIERNSDIKKLEVK